MDNSIKSLAVSAGAIAASVWLLTIGGDATRDYDRPHIAVSWFSSAPASPVFESRRACDAHIRNALPVLTCRVAN